VWSPADANRPYDDVLRAPLTFVSVSISVTAFERTETTASVSPSGE
jgi:hypothetical protein